MFAIADMLGIDLMSPEPNTTAENAETLVPLIGVSAVAPITALVLGLRSANSGNRSGAIATAVAGALLLVGLLIPAASATVEAVGLWAIAVGVMVAVVYVAAVYVAWRRWNVKHHRAAGG